MLKVLLIGYSTVGKMHERKLRELGHDLFIVDPNEAVQFRSLSNINDDFFKQMNVFDICTPTISHLSVLEEIAERSPFSRVLLEKPVCDVIALEKMRKFLKKYPAARLYVSSPYRYASPLLEMLNCTNDFLLKGKKITSINIGFSKNRTFDESNGRFLDPLGAIGYEFFHILEILSMILSKTHIDVAFFLHCR